MLQEFAIEPSVLNSWSRYEYFMADCGVEKGRLVSEFPWGQWKRPVWEAVSSNPKQTSMEKKRVEVHLKDKVEAMLVYTGRRFQFQPDAPPWLDQALREHATNRFRAIISAVKLEAAPDVIQVDDFDKLYLPAWNVHPTCSIKRTPEDISGLLNPLCRESELVKLLDPHFDPGKSRFKDTFRKMFEVIRPIARQSVRIEVHCGCKLNYQEFKDKLHEEWPRLIPAGRTVYFFRWEEKPQGEQLHRRMILAKRGGILVEAGLDSGYEGQTTTAALLSSKEHYRFWIGLENHGQPGPPPTCLFKFHDNFEVTGWSASGNRHRP